MNEFTEEELSQNAIIRKLSSISRVPYHTLLEEASNYGDVLKLDTFNDRVGKSFYIKPVRITYSKFPSVFFNSRYLQESGLVDEFQQGYESIEGAANYIMIVHHPKSRSCWVMHQNDSPEEGKAKFFLTVDKTTYVLEKLKDFFKRYILYEDEENEVA